MSATIVQLVGYAGSILVVLSFTMRRIVPLRLVSVSGAVVTAVYGLLISAWPVLITNVVIVGIHAWYLYREFTMSHEFDLVPVEVDAPFLTDFLVGHLADIRKFQPDFTVNLPNDVAYVYMRDGMPAGTLLGSRQDDRLNVHLDYVLPPFRDSRLGRWLYESGGSRSLRATGLREIASRAGTDTHRRFLESMGFVADGDRYVRKL
ncbi:MAG TPA: hypothetical protein VLS51_02400 [Propionibacteriaceae bacterium]|nr:hypothetical protein [Propionibacteriaceae bacterium]